jgi:hypothetical protein
VEGKSLYSAAFDRDGALWISSFVHGVFRRVEGRWSAFPLRSSVGATGVLIPDPAGGMWIRYSGGGLFHVDGDRTRDYSHNGLDIGDVTFIRPRGRGVLIGGENGMGSLRDGRFHALRASEMPVLSGVTGIADTPDGSSWIFAQAGILRANTASLEAALAHSDPRLLRYELLDSRDGLPGGPYGAVGGASVATDAGGRVWFTTGNGLAWIDPGNLHHNPLAPNVLVDSLLVDGHRHAATPELQLPPAHRMSRSTIQRSACRSRSGCAFVTGWTGSTVTGSMRAIAARPSTPAWRRANTAFTSLPPTATACGTARGRR